MNARDDSATSTWAAVLTPVGRGAIAAVSVCGPAAMSAVERFFHAVGRTPLSESSPRRIVLGRWGAATGEEIVACRIAACEVELHCHGGPAAAQRIVDDLVTAGVATQSWQEHLVRQADDAWRREALEQLALATTERAAAILLDQAQGALRRALDHAMAEFQRGDAAAARQRLQAILARASLGQRLGQPWRVVLCGRPNVGKSSLLNALAGYRRAIAFDRPGTTRDAVTVLTAIEGWPVELIDTAGLRPSNDELEQAGIDRAYAALRSCDLAVLVSDRSAGWTLEDGRLWDEWPGALVVHNKCDLPSASDDDRPAGLAISCQTGQGLAELQAAVARRLVPNPPDPGEAVPISAEQTAFVQRAVADSSNGRPPLSLLALSG